MDNVRISNISEIYGNAPLTALMKDYSYNYLILFNYNHVHFFFIKAVKEHNRIYLWLMLSGVSIATEANDVGTPMN